MAEPASFDAFISYSRKDVLFAAELERALERYTPPREIRAERRSIVVCRDQEDLAGPEYYEAVRQHLARSKKLIVICSPAARASEFVNDEIRRFAEIHGAGGIVSVLLSGVPNNAAGENDAENLAFPPALCELVSMPLAIPYVGFEPSRDRVNRGVFYGSWYTLLANLLDADRAAIEERDRRRKARVRNSWIGGTSTVVAILAGLTVWALAERRTALRRGEVMLAQRLAAEARAPTTLEPTAVERRALAAVEAVQRLDALGEPIDDAAAALRDVSALLARRVLQLGPGHQAVAFSGDGLTAFAAQAANVSAYTLRTGARMATLDAGEPVASLMTNADGRYLGAITDSGTVRVWAGQSWTPRDAPVSGDRGRAVCAAFSDDGRYGAALVASGQSRRVSRLVVWRTDQGRVVAETSLAAPNGPVAAPGRGDCLQVGTTHLLTRYQAADTSPVISAALWRWRPATEVDSSALVWLPSLRGPSLREWHGLSNVAWRTDSTSLALIDANGGTRVAFTDGRDVGRSREQTAPTPSTERGPEATHSARRSNIQLLAGWMSAGVLDPGYGPRIGSPDGIMALTPDSGVMLTGVGERVRLWRTDDGREIMRIATATPVTGLTVSPAGQHLATWDSAGSVAVWDLGHPSEALRVPGGRIASASADGRRIAVGTALGVSIATQDSVTPLVSIPLLGGAGKVVVSRDGRYVVAIAGDPSGINLLGDRLRTVVLDLGRGVDTVLTTALASVAEFTPDSRSLVLGTSDSVVRLIRLDDRATRWEKRFEGGRATRVAFSADGRVAALALEPAVRSTAVAVVVSTETGDVLRRVENRSSSAIALSADGSELASASDTVLTIVRVRDGAITAQLRHPPPLGTIRHAAFREDGKVMSVAGKLESSFMAAYFADEGAFLWDARTGAIESRLPGDIGDIGRVDNGRTGRGAAAQPHLTDMAWTPDGREIAARVFENREEYWGTPGALARGELRVWRLGGATPEELFRATPDGWTRVVGLSGEAGLLFTVGDGGLRAWNYHPRGLVAEACRRLTRTLTAAEWRTLIGADKPQPTCTVTKQP